MKNSYMNNEKCSGVEILYNLSFFRSQFQISHSQLLFFNSQFSILNLYQNLVMNSITILSRSDSLGIPEFL